MGEMDAVVAGGVIPPTMYIDIAATLARNLQMAIGFVKESARALAFEVVDDVRQRIAFENIVFNRE